MKFLRRVGAVAMMSVLLMPLAAPSALAETRDKRCDVQQQDEDDCKETRKAFQTKFFGQ